MTDRNTFRLLPHIRKSKVNADGLTPIWIRITINGQRAHVALGKNISPNDWSMRRKLPKKDPGYRELTELISDAKAKLRIHYYTLLGTHTAVTAEDVKRRFRGIEVERPGETLLNILNEFSLKQGERYRAGKLTFSRYRKWEQLWNSCRTFLRYKYRVNDMRVTKVRPFFTDDFFHYLMTVKKLHQNTAMKRIKDFKQVMTYAVTREYIPVNPAHAFKCALIPVNRTRLTKREIEILSNRVIPDTVLDEVRDCFVFVIYTGYSYKELSELTMENVQTGVDGRKWIIKTRSKSNESKENVPLLTVPLKIIEKYALHPGCLKNNKLLPVGTNIEYNKLLKSLAKFCKIDKRLTSHVARHTFATTIMLENKVPMETVSKMLGHRDLKTTQIYAEMTDIRISEDTLDLDRRLQSAL